MLAVAWAGVAVPSGLARNEIWWLAVVALALSLFAFSAQSGWRVAGAIAATFLIGSSAQLALKDPLWFQILSIRPTSAVSYAMLGAIALQGAVAALVLARPGALAQGLRAVSALGWPRVVLVVLLLLGISIGVIEYVSLHQSRRLLKQLFVASSFSLINILSFTALVASLPGGKLGEVSAILTRNLSVPGASGQLRRLDGGFRSSWLRPSSPSACF